MSAATTTAERSGVGTNSKLLRKLAAGTSVAAVLAVTTIAVWPASETEKARDDGQRVGAAVAQLQSADTTEEVDTALAELHDAAASTADHAGDAVANQVDDQVYALDRAVDGFVGTHTADDSFSADVYQSELNTAVDDLTSQADDFRTSGPEVQQAFWDGYQDGLND